MRYVNQCSAVQSLIHLFSQNAIDDHDPNSSTEGMTCNPHIHASKNGLMSAARIAEIAYVPCEYGKAGPGDLDRRGGGGMLIGIANGVAYLSGALLRRFPDLTTYGLKLGQKLEQRAGLIWPVGCKCYQTYNGGQVLYHIPTFIVLSCLPNADC